MASFYSIDDLPALQGEIVGRRVLVRGDLNVPVKDGRVTDATRIERLAPTILALVERRCRVAVLAHFGRPKGRRNPAMSLKPLVGPLGQALGGRAVAFSDDCIGPNAEEVVNSLPGGGVALLRICGSIRERRRIILASQKRSQGSVMSTSTTPSRRHIERMPRRKPWHACCRRPLVAPCRRSSRRWTE